LIRDLRFVIEIQAFSQIAALKQTPAVGVSRRKLPQSAFVTLALTLC